jgi:tetratricopeptide (TPR) repeat protein
MQTKLSRICDAIIEAGWLAALVVTPLFFDTYTNRVFEPDKIHLLRSITLVMVVAWLVQLVDGGWRETEGTPVGLWSRIRRTPLVLPTLILVGAYLVSTVFSVVPRISFLGSYVRSQGTYTFLCYVAIFFMVLSHMRTRAQVNRVLHAVILSSLPIAIYGIIQHTQVAPGISLDPLPWGGDVTQRVAGNMGNSIFVAAYLIMALFLTLERLVDGVAALINVEHGTMADALRTAGYLFVIAVQLITIVYTQSRGPQLGLVAGLLVFVALGALLAVRWAARRTRDSRWLERVKRLIGLGLVGILALGLAFLVLLNRPTGPLARLRGAPYIGRMATLLNTTAGTNAVRVLIWEGVVDMMLKPHAPIQYPDGRPDLLNGVRPLIGYGPESMWVAYNRFYPPDLAHYEARNASPDRSHNETFDALVRTGLLGLAAQLVLYGSLFYYALRWLGLMQGRGRRILFLGLLVGGAILGVGVPWLFDGSLRLSGIGLPVGFIFGLIAYVVLDLLLSPAASAGDEDGAGALPAGRDPAGPVSRGSPSGGGRRQLLILAVFSAIVAHFVEIHFGIAIVSTLTLFWTLAGLLVVVGMGWVGSSTQFAVSPSALPEARLPEAAVPASSYGKAPTAQPASSPKGKGSKSEKRAPNPQSSQRQGASQRRPGSEQSRIGRGTGEVSPAWALPSPLSQLLPYVGIGMLVTLVLTWDFLVNQSGAQGALAVLWDAFTTRVDKVSYEVIRSPMLLFMLIFTWMVGGLIALSECAAAWSPDALRLGQAGTPAGQPREVKMQRGGGARGRSVFPWGLSAVIYLATVAGTFLVYGLLQAGRTSLEGLTGMDALQHVANHVVVFDLVLLLAGLGLAAAVWWANPRLLTGRVWGRSPFLSLAAGAVAAAAVLLVVLNVNIRTVQADTYYKQGLAYEGTGGWESAITLYREAGRLEPAEDFYYLFLGRALLSYANGVPASGNPVLPADLDNASTRELLSFLDRGLQTGNRDDILRATYAALLAARRMNPLNTDHSANLARLSRSWAFANALGPNDSTSDPALREVVATNPEKVDLKKLDQALVYYDEATSLSPHNAQLSNELATVQYIKGDTGAALKTLDHSLTLDPRFAQTYLLKGDVMSAAGDRRGALESYREASALVPADINVQNAVGILSAQTGDTQGALDAFQRIINTQSKALASVEKQLAELDSAANAGGGYSALPPTAASRRDALQNSIANYRSRLHLVYRNMAIVLRDAGRSAEALQAAQAALPLAGESERPTIEALISDLSKTLSAGEGQPGK